MLATHALFGDVASRPAHPAWSPRGFLPWLVHVKTDDPSRRRRGQILAFLCVPLFLGGAAFLVVDFVGWLIPPSEYAAYNMTTDALFGLLIATAWFLNRRGRVTLAAIVQLSIISVGLVMFFHYTSPYRIEVLFVIPVVAAAFILAPPAAFLWAGISAVSFIVMNNHHGGEPRLGIQVGLALFGVAIIAWLVASCLEWTVTELRRTSRDLEADIAAREEAEEARRQVEAALELTRQQSQTLFERSSLGVFLFDKFSLITECNERFATQMRTSRAQLVGRDLAIAPEQRALPAMCQALAGEIGSYEGPYATPGGEELWVNFTASPLRGPGAEVIGGIGVVTDLTDAKQAEVLVERLAYRDALTGLPNRSLFGDRLRQALAVAERHHQKLVTGVLDIDRFKTINDTLGHQAGDRLLVGVAERLGALMRDCDTAARSGGDEFLLLFADVAAERDTAAVGRRILAALSEPWQVEGRRVYVSASIGFASYPSDAADPSALLENAHTAMRRAKEQGGDTLQFYDSSVSSMAAERLVIESELHAAIEAQQFTALYQPQVDIRDGSIVGLEALARWRHPRRGLLPPSEFIALAEETGMIVPLGRQILRIACTQARKWQAMSSRPLPVAVNVSARQLREAGLTDDVERVLAATGLDPGLLEIEITETATLSHAEHAEAVLLRLREMGVGVSLDDFGTGYSSLSQLRRLPITRLKIDRSFVNEIASNNGSAAIACAVIDLAYALGLGLVAEGVETCEQFAFLEAHRCYEVQGFLLGHPMSSDDCDQLIARGAVDLPQLQATTCAAVPEPLLVRRRPR